MKKGFTLIELLGVITLLGLLAAISIPIIDNSLNKAKDGLSKTQEKQIIKSAEDYYTEHLSDLPDCQLNDGDCSSSTTITFENLQEEGYLSLNVTNEKDGSLYDPVKWGVKVTVNKNSNGKRYTYEVVEINSEG